MNDGIWIWTFSSKNTQLHNVVYPMFDHRESPGIFTFPGWFEYPASFLSTGSQSFTPVPEPEQVYIYDTAGKVFQTVLTCWLIIVFRSYLIRLLLFKFYSLQIIRLPRSTAPVKIKASAECTWEPIFQQGFISSPPFWATCYFPNLLVSQLFSGFATSP